MNMREALLRARLSLEPCFIMKDKDGDYSIETIRFPKGAEFFHFGDYNLATPITPEAHEHLRKLINSVIYRKSVRLPGKKIVRRGSK